MRLSSDCNVKTVSCLMGAQHAKRPVSDAVRGLRILVVEDEPDISDLIRLHLEGEGFIVSVSGNGLDAWNRMENALPDAVILDLMLPGIGGLDLCRKIKGKYAGVPVIMVTAKGSETDAVVGLEIGADDYIRKPFSPRELLARLRTVLRRHAPPGEAMQGKLTAGTIVLDVDAHRVAIQGKQIELTLLEFQLLQFLMENPDIAFGRDRLLDRVWGREIYVSDRTVDVNVKRLREKLGEEDYRLETVRGVGYRFLGS